ncbi:hypothetical protein AAG570_003202 [Ranatra chinensis]|uniref:CD80-like immunoglobulin C2-set domain-containing protein n=1 Tax=Ranatra chinensis TaxID=642074 RepID=A0ABD0Y646_9HEMI
MASKHRNTFYENKKRETTKIAAMFRHFVANQVGALSSEQETTDYEAQPRTDENEILKKSDRCDVKPSNSAETSNDGNTTTSTLSFVATKEDDGKNLTCKAENPVISSETLYDYWTLHIH